MTVFVMTKKLSKDVEQYMGVECSRNLAEESFKKKYPDMKRTDEDSDEYVSDESDHPETLFIHRTFV